MASFFPSQNISQIIPQANASATETSFPPQNAGGENKPGREVSLEESWKIFKPHHGFLLIKLCKECQVYLYNDKTKFSLEGVKAVCRIPLCYDCYKGNVITNGTNMKYFPWKKSE